MRFVHFTLVLLIWLSVLSCLNAIRFHCNTTTSAPCEFTIVEDANLINLAEECYCDNEHIQCVKDNLEDFLNSTRILFVEIVNVTSDNCKLYDTRKFLEQIGLKEVKDVTYWNEVGFPIRIDSNVSLENGIKELDIYFIDTLINETTFVDYDNLTKLSIHTNVKEEVPVDLFLKFKHLNIFEWYNDVPYIFPADLLYELNDLKELSIVFKTPIEDEPALKDVKCQRYNFDLRKVAQVQRLLMHRTFYDCLDKNLFNRFFGLQHLTIGFNSQLKKLPIGIFDDLLSLKSLHLIYNGLENLEGELFKTLNALEEIDVSKNNLKVIYWQWPLLPKLETLHTVGNANLTFINIHLRSGNFHFIYPDKDISKISTDAFICERSVDKCDFLHDKNMKTCPIHCECSYIPNTGNITLDVSNNTRYLRMNSDDAYGLNEVNYLLASNNSLSYLQLFAIPEHIVHLDLRNNKFTHFDEEILELFLKRLQKNKPITFKLSGNPWICECYNWSFANFTQLEDQFILDKNNVDCVYILHEKKKINECTRM